MKNKEENNIINWNQFNQIFELLSDICKMFDKNISLRNIFKKNNLPYLHYPYTTTLNDYKELLIEIKTLKKYSRLYYFNVLEFIVILRNFINKIFNPNKENINSNFKYTINYSIKLEVIDKKTEESFHNEWKPNTLKNISIYKLRAIFHHSENIKIEDSYAFVWIDIYKNYFSLKLKFYNEKYREPELILENNFEFEINQWIENVINFITERKEFIIEEKNKCKNIITCINLYNTDDLFEKFEKIPQEEFEYSRNGFHRIIFIKKYNNKLLNGYKDGFLNHLIDIWKTNKYDLLIDFFIFLFLIQHIEINLTHLIKRVWWNLLMKQIFFMFMTKNALVLRNIVIDGVVMMIL